MTGACLAEAGHHVLCMDIDKGKIDGLKMGHVPIYEPGLEVHIEDNVRSGHLRFTSEVTEAVAFSELQFIAVGTPPDEDGSADLQYVKAVARQIGVLMESPKMIVTKSTVPVGTSEMVRNTVAIELASRGVDLGFHVASNP